VQNLLLIYILELFIIFFIHQLERQIANSTVQSTGSTDGTRAVSVQNSLLNSPTMSSQAQAPSVLARSYRSAEEEYIANQLEERHQAEQLEDDAVIQQSLQQTDDDDADTESNLVNRALPESKRSSPDVLSLDSSSNFGSSQVSEERISAPSPIHSVRQSTGFGSPVHVVDYNNRPSTSSSVFGGPKSGSDRRHLLFLIEQKERIISKLQGQVEKFVRRVAELERETRSTPFVSRSTAGSVDSSALPRNAPMNSADDESDRFRLSEYCSLRREGRRRLVDRIYSISTLLQASSNLAPTASSSRTSHAKSGAVPSASLSLQMLADLPKDSVPMIVELQRMLAEEAAARQFLEIVNNSKLFAAEQLQAQWYVEKKLLEAETVELRQQLQQRDELDRHIESRVLTMMDRLREFETENVQLKFSLQQFQQQQQRLTTGSLSDKQ
jgi:hypothetical protein